MAAADTVTMMARDYVDERSKVLIDGVFQATRLGRTLRESARNWPGGIGVNEYVKFAGSGGGPHKPNKRFTNKQRQTSQQLKWTPKLTEVPLVVNLTDVRVFNAPSPYRVLDILDDVIPGAYMTLGAQMETLLFLPGTNSTSLTANIDGMAESVNDGTNPSFDGVVYDRFGELQRSNPNWGKAIKGNVKVLGAEISNPVLETTYTKCTVGGAEPNLGYTTPVIKSNIKFLFLGQQRFNEVTDPTFGFVGFRYNRAMIIESRYCPGEEILSQDEANDVVAVASEDEATPLTAYPLAGTANNRETFWWFNTADEYMHYYISTDRIFGMGIQDFIGSALDDMLVGRVRLAYMFAMAGNRYQYQINGIKNPNV